MQSEPSTCECPEYPNWMWRYNRNKHLSKFQPWYTRVERWPPHYRNMGVGDNFRFHPLDDCESKSSTFQPGLNYAKQLMEGRQAGSGNKALGLSPGPAPPMFIYPEANPHVIGELLTVNRIERVSDGAALHNEVTIPMMLTRTGTPINPREYLSYTLGQRMEYPGTFPHINGTTGPSSATPGACCGGSGSERPDPLAYWLDYNRKREAGLCLERQALPRPFPEYCCEQGWPEEKIQCRN